MVHLRGGETSAAPPARPGRRQNLRLLGHNYNRGTPRPGTRPHLGQPTGEDVRLARGTPTVGQRCGNAVYVYKPDFTNGGYREA